MRGAEQNKTSSGNNIQKHCSYGDSYSSPSREQVTEAGRQAAAACRAPAVLSVSTSCKKEDCFSCPDAAQRFFPMFQPVLEDLI